MADTLSFDVRAKVAWVFKEALDLANVIDSGEKEYKYSFADGTGSSQADKVWADQRTVTAAANDDLDLTALTDSIFGSTRTISFAKIRGIYIQNTSTTAGEELQLDSSVAASIVAPFAASTTSKLQIPEDSCILLVNKITGWTVTNTTADVLRITSTGAASIVYNIAIWGTSA